MKEFFMAIFMIPLATIMGIICGILFGIAIYIRLAIGIIDEIIKK